MLYLKAGFVILLLACILWAALPVVGENESDVIIGRPEISELFAAQYRYYQSQSAGSISIQNSTDKNLRAEVSVTVSGCTSNPIIVAASLPAGKTTQVPFKMNFSIDELPTREEKLLLDAEVEVCVYAGKERLCQKRLTDRFQLHSLHRLPDEPPEAVAVFVDASDRSVIEFAQEINAELLYSNSEKAQRLFGLMQQARIICMDQAAKTVRYPRELLRIKFGSSYDCALLYAALLENCNVPVALTVSDEYILVLIQQKQQIAGHEQKKLVSWNNRSWMPIDIRMLEATFSEAKAAGMQSYEGLSREGKMKPFILREVWDQYAPVRFVVPQSVKEMQLGITCAYREELEKAEQIFSKYLDDDISAAASNNLGNISLRCNNLEEAVQHYQAAIEKDPGDNAIYLNMGIAYAIEGKDKEAAAMFDHALRELGSYAQMRYALGIKSDGQDHEEVRQLLREAEERALKSQRTRPMGVRGALDNKQSPLYWKRR